MDDYDKRKIKNITIYSLCSISGVVIYGTGVNLSKNSPYHTPIFIAGFVLSLSVPRILKKILLKDDDEDNWK